MGSPKVDFDELKGAFEVISMGLGDGTAFVCSKTGAVYVDVDATEDDLPEDLYESEYYIEIPAKRDLDLGKPLVLDYVAKHLPEEYENVQEIFSSKGAYGNFKYLLQARGKLEQWHEFEDSAAREALITWAQDHNLEVDI